MKPLILQVKEFRSPEKIYALLAGETNTVFLDSAKNSYNMGRYSFIARDPFLVFSSKGTSIVLEQGKNKQSIEGCPFTKLQELMQKYKTEKIPDMPPLLGGAIGFFSYDLGYLVEKLPEKAVDDVKTKDCWFGFYDCVAAFDHQEEKCYIVSTGFPEQNEAARLQRAKARAAEMKAIISKAVKLALHVKPVAEGKYQSNFTHADYCQALRQAIEYIYAGDIFQMNMTQRFSVPFSGDPYAMYRYLRYINPAPFAAYLNCGDTIVASASPERYLLLKDRFVETRPIKGTRPRGHNSETDKALREELENSEKDRAELTMIIDLARNDLGRVCEYGSVQVPELIRLEEYATVFHLVSTIVGKLAEDKDVIELIKASFPGGSITGAPKIRAMEIIDKLEPQRRGIYTGSIGYMDFNGDADLNIVIRTIIIKDAMAYFQAGGGIVADSQPELEYEETLHKAKALLMALGQIE